ncbi:helix-turn-helix transcriptional regulator [Haloarchaeobius iranensis]|uniref:IclR helix-turn-helix domain-containing protein n=1 Tax=Haloarchaeobius iranensis TaxID=996166 RepID=A0A1G9VF80_9EURY|nr:hypothetical protein [Haloarchaeobius iranensis]SDM70928.1 hypothetical protein SAMN05192554_10685 [Haloarchaeobius iranensis]
MRSLSAFAVALLALSLVAAPVVGVPSGGAGTAAEQGDRPGVQAVDSHSFEEASPATVFEVNVTASGDARWSITYRYVLNSSNETEAFERFGEDVATGTTDVGFSPQMFQRFAERAQAWTDREMTIEAAGWEEVRVRERPEPADTTTTTATGTTATGTENGTTTYIGELTYSFVWTNFAAVEENTVVVGDVFGTENETWFNQLYEDQRFVLNSPTNYGIRDSPDDKGPDNGTLVWDGPATFEPGYLEATYFELASPNTTTPTGPGPGPEDERLSPFLLVGLVGILVVAAAGGAYMFAKRQSETPAGGGPAPTPNGGQDGTLDADDGADPTDGPSGGAAAETAETEPDGDDDVDEELLSDEERVLRLLDDNGGRMKQANIVKETGWSNAKVSQLLSGMADDEEIRKLRIGRENLITLPDESLGEFDDEQ